MLRQTVAAQEHPGNGRTCGYAGLMPDSPLFTAAAIAVIVLAVAVVVGVGLKVIRSFRDLGTDAERATYTTLHAASRAGQQRHVRPAARAASCPTTA